MTGRAMQGTAALVVRRGARPGRRLKLEGTAFRIGRQEDCDLVLTDGYVSPVHAVVERQGEGWVVRNQGVHATLVNGEPVQGTRVLAAGDVLQVGAETLLELAVAAPSRRARAQAPAVGARPWWQHPAVLAGIGVYLAAVVGFFVFLAGLDAERDRGLDFDTVGLATASTRDFLLSPEADGDGDARGALDPHADPSHDFHALAALRREGQRSEAERLAGRILQEVEADFFQAWQYEQRGAYALAIARYERILARVPTLRAPVTRLASARIRVLRDRVRE